MKQQPMTPRIPISVGSRHAQLQAQAPIYPAWDNWREFANAAKADINMCWICGACDNGCPVNIASERLSPQRLVRMAIYGMMDELLSSPIVWYCLSCRRCFQGCPNRVKPYELIKYIQMESIRRKRISLEFLFSYRKLISDFQRVRWRAAAHCLNNRLNHLPDSIWYKWLRKPIQRAVYRSVKLGRTSSGPNNHLDETIQRSRACLTCSECSGCCPITCDGGVFDPQRIIRMANLGLNDELLKSPAIWLCLGCQLCTEACAQTVSGYAIIQRLRQQAIENKIVDRDFPIRLLEADRLIFPKLLDEIDALIGLHQILQ
jgi:heterodisulfide reductase subunit C